MLTQGLRIEILLEEAYKCINQLSQVNKTDFAVIKDAISMPSDLVSGNITSLSKETAGRSQCDREFGGTLDGSSSCHPENGSW